MKRKAALLNPDVSVPIVPKSDLNLLKDTRCYLIGHMQYCNGRGWRDTIKTEFKKSGIKFYDPYHKPFVHDIPEDEASPTLQISSGRWQMHFIWSTSSQRRRIPIDTQSCLSRWCSDWRHSRFSQCPKNQRDSHGDEVWNARCRSNMERPIEY